MKTRHNKFTTMDRLEQPITWCHSPFEHNCSDPIPKSKYLNQQRRTITNWTRTHKNLTTAAAPTVVLIEHIRIETEKARSKPSFFRNSMKATYLEGATTGNEANRTSARNQQTDLWWSTSGHTHKPTCFVVYHTHKRVAKQPLKPTSAAMASKEETTQTRCKKVKYFKETNIEFEIKHSDSRRQSLTFINSFNLTNIT